MKPISTKAGVWVPDLGNGTYRNPILHADYSDPDVIRVGADFYLVASSFAHMPGLPILHSRDLVNWTIAGHVIDKFDYPGYDRPQHGCAVWAPSIRYHDGKFWVFFSAPDEGIFMCTAEDPLGKWSGPHLVHAVKGWIDPCPFWDDDGQAYLVHAFARSRCGIKHKLKLCRMAPDGTSLLDEGVIVYDGTENHPTMEGPKMYKRDGYYYIFAPAGGVHDGWQTVLRSKSIYGPYEDKIVLHQGSTGVNGPHQGGWVELESGESWFLHFQDRDAYGRIVHLQPVEWVDGWPLMGHNRNEEGIGEPVDVWKKPDVGGEFPIAVPATSDDFSGAALGLQWQWQANPNPNWYSLENAGSLRLFSHPLPDASARLYDAPQLLMQKFPAPAFTVTTKLSLQMAEPGDRAGLVVFGRQYAYLALCREAGETYRLSLFKGDENASADVEVSGIGFASTCVTLRVAVEEPALCRFSYSTDGEHFHSIGGPFPAKEGVWVGAKVGVFAANLQGVKANGYADVAWFQVTE